MFTNAGFDITPALTTANNVVVDAGSLVFYAENQMYFMQILAMSLMVLGAIGFWPLAEFKMWIQAKFKKEKYEFSLFTKLLVTMHLGIWIVSAVFVFIVEYNNAFADTSLLDSIFYSLFMSLTTRNAGFATMSMNDMSDTVQVFFGILMFIGSSPNSAGGGIRTTTFLLTILGMYSFSRGREQVVLKKKSLKFETVYKSLMVVIGAAGLIMIGLLIMTLTEPFSVQEIFFEIASAFGTTGLSLGITSQLGVVGKLTLIVIMFVGRIGILALLLMFKSNKPTTSISYPEMDIIVG
jgi:Trk-type K+ transport system membrane component